MKYKYFLFDWDGSLGNSLSIWFDAFQKVFAEYGKRMTYKQIGEKVIGDWEGPTRMGIENAEEFFTRMEVELMPKLPELLVPNFGACCSGSNLNDIGVCDGFTAGHTLALA